MSEGAMTKDEFVQEMKTLREAAAKEEAKKAKQREYAKKAYEKKKAEKAEAAADPEGVTLTGAEAAMLSQYIKDTICHALDGDYYFNEDMIFTLVHLADRLGGVH